MEKIEGWKWREMENGGGGLESKFAGLRIQDSGHISGNNNDGLFQVMKAVEAAEATIKQQVFYSSPFSFCMYICKYVCIIFAVEFCLGSYYWTFRL